MSIIWDIDHFVIELISSVRLILLSIVSGSIAEFMPSWWMKVDS